MPNENENQKKSTKSEVITQYFSKVKGWAIEEDVFHKELPPKKNIKYAFLLKYQIKKGNKPKVLCFFPEDKDYFILQAQTFIHPKHTPILLKTDEEKRWEFISELSKFATYNDLTYTYHLGGKPPLFFQINTQTYFDEASKGLFFKLFHRIARGNIFMTQMFQHIILESTKDINIDAKSIGISLDDKPKHSSLFNDEIIDKPHIVIIYDEEVKIREFPTQGSALAFMKEIEKENPDKKIQTAYIIDESDDLKKIDL
ncbi:MAG: DUF2299 domain-containing protein [Candidatus Lokiarchaeota archaeon]|nr:DUF2299 domain-containing protein [Candidatus Lokiarchaeota archaeon]